MAGYSRTHARNEYGLLRRRERARIRGEFYIFPPSVNLVINTGVGGPAARFSNQGIRSQDEESESGRTLMLIQRLPDV